MTVKRNILKDQANTKLAIERWLTGDKRKSTRSWLGHSGGAKELDFMLIDGATKEELEKKRGRVNNHIFHLKKEHGISVCKQESRYIFQESILSQKSFGEKMLNNSLKKFSKRDTSILLIDELRKVIKETITNWTKEMENDYEKTISLAQIGGEQIAFTNWMIECININGKKAWWNPMCLFRSYHLKRREPEKKLANQIRAEIRAATEAPCPFRSGAWNRDYNKKIFTEWLKNNNYLVTEALKKNEAIDSSQNDSLFPEEVVSTDKENFCEGSVKQILVNAFERDSKARQRCIELFGLSCVVCGFNFEKEYGEIGKDFIHVHHLKPLSEVRAEYKVDPEKDMCPVCPNCHEMIHRRQPPYPIEEIRRMIRAQPVA